jgi:23S rRNA pseudouridine2605 synthase
VAVGRLDFASTGLLIFTNDTALADRLTDPDRRVPRTYVVTVRGRLTPETARRLQEEHAAATRLEIRKASNRETHLIVELIEGKNRELRRLFGGAGHEPTRIHRISFGEYDLGDLQPGKWRTLPP